jgi:hypothetical protein
MNTNTQKQSNKMNSMSFATILIKPAKQPAVLQVGSEILSILTSRFLMCFGNASSATTSVLKLFVFILGLDDWARENPKIWDNKNGISVYSYNKAWGKSEDETLTRY